MPLQKPIGMAGLGSLAADAPRSKWSNRIGDESSLVRHAKDRLAETWDPVQTLRGVGCLAVLGFTAWCEWQALRWLAVSIYNVM